MKTNKVSQIFLKTVIASTLLFNGSFALAETPGVNDQMTKIQKICAGDIDTSEEAAMAVARCKNDLLNASTMSLNAIQNQVTAIESKIAKDADELGKRGFAVVQVPLAGAVAFTIMGVVTGASAAGTIGMTETGAIQRLINLGRSGYNGARSLTAGIWAVAAVFYGASYVSYSSERMVQLRVDLSDPTLKTKISDLQEKMERRKAVIQQIIELQK